MTKKIFRSIFTIALVVLLSSIGIATSFIYNYFNTSQVNQLKAELSLVADTVNEVGIEYFEKFNSTVFRFTVIDADGTVLYDTQANTNEMENHAEREEIAEAFTKGTGSSARNSHTLTKKTFYEAILLENGNDITFSGGECSLQAKAFTKLAHILKAAGRNIWLYSGHTYTELIGNTITKKFLDSVDVLVDGKFINSLSIKQKVNVRVCRT